MCTPALPNPSPAQAAAIAITPRAPGCPPLPPRGRPPPPPPAGRAHRPPPAGLGVLAVPHRGAERPGQQRQRLLRPHVRDRVGAVVRHPLLRALVLVGGRGAGGAARRRGA